MTTEREDYWGSDAPVSAPEPMREDRPALTNFGGFAFTADGLCVALSESDLEEMVTPHFAPPGTQRRSGD